MPEFCRYGNCHNLASFSYQGYCNKDHFEHGRERELLMKIVEKVPTVSTIREARKFLLEFVKKRHYKEDLITSSSRYAEYTESHHE
jgi:hypothetical protein